MSTDSVPPFVHVFDDPEAVARAAARRFVEQARAAIESSGRFSVALAGGSTPKRVYQLLANDAGLADAGWSRVHVFFGDERCVPPDHQDSNYLMAREALLSRVRLPAQNVHRMAGEVEPEKAAREYEEELRRFFGDAAWPRFDLVMLGMGDDGHTASLFPGTPALGERSRWVVSNRVEKLGADRLTLTAPAINAAAHVLFLVTGAAKADRLPQVVKGPHDPEILPSQLICPANGTLEWYVDCAAAAEL